MPDSDDDGTTHISYGKKKEFAAIDGSLCYIGMDNVTM